MVEATNKPWRLCESGVWPAWWCATAASGIIVSKAVETAAPDDVLLLPAVASELMAALRAELLLALAAAVVFAEEAEVVPVVLAVAALTVPAGAFDVAVPEAPPPEVAT